MKILLHAPLHPSYWIYLMECMPEHEWFIEPNDDFEEGQTPRDHIKYIVVPKDSKIKFDVQIIPTWYLDKLYQILEDFPIPPVFLEIAGYPLPKFEVKYPLISGTTYHSNNQYPNIRYSYVVPSKTLWDKEWKGDVNNVLIPAQRYLDPEYSNSKMAQIIPILKKGGINVDIITGKRTMPFNEWRDKFIHNRVLLDCSQKYASFVVEEAMMVGMPIVCLDQYESGIMIRNGIDGFTRWTDSELVSLLRQFTADKTFANEWSIKSKARGKEILDSEKTRQVFNQAIIDSIALFKSSKDPFMRELPKIPNKSIPDLTFICWELKNREKNLDWGYPVRGYPRSDYLISAFTKLGLKTQPIEFCDYASVKLESFADKPFPYRTLGMNIRSDHVLLEWDGITAKRDYQSIFDWNKKLYIIPHHEGRVAGYYATPEDERIMRAKITKYSTKVIFELQTLRDLWKEFECDKFVLLYPPVRTGIKIDKDKARKILGIKTKYVLIAWGEYTSGKHYGDILSWIKEWGDTSLLFCGSGEHTEKKALQDKVIELGLQDKVLFSEHGISDEDADVWFSASDLCSCPRTYFGTATPIYVIGQGKVIVLPKNTSWFESGSYEELEKISGVVVSENVKRTTRILLIDERKRKDLEKKSIKYANVNSFEHYAKRIMKMMK